MHFALEVLKNCEFGLWTNGRDMFFAHKYEDKYDNTEIIDISDFPAKGQSLDDLEHADKATPKTPSGTSLIRVFKQCHDYIYGNEGRVNDTFWQLLYLIFCKIYDEKRRFMVTKNGDSYRRRFWVGATERSTPEKQKKVAERIKAIFEELKNEENDHIFSSVFSGTESIELTDKGLAFVASQIAKYSFLDATVDVKGTAYESIVSGRLKQERGQFFIPRNIIRCMVEMLDPEPHHRILDPCCGSGGFLVNALEHIRHKIAQQFNPDKKGVWLEQEYNSMQVNEAVRNAAEKNIFGFDFDPDLKKAARMNMIMFGDGHTNIFHVNSLAYPAWETNTELDSIKQAIAKSLQNASDKNEVYGSEDARGKFDIIFTNPPFGAKVTVDPEIAQKYELNQFSNAPEVLFVEACYNFLKPGGRMAIVLPDGILGNPNTEPVREWILKHFRLLASIDLAVEAFLPQVGVQASLLFLQKKTETEQDLAHFQEEDYEVFMAIAEKLGKDRRGVPIYLRDEDGQELIFEVEKEYLVQDAENLTQKIRKTRKEKVKKLNDDLPLIAQAYIQFRKEGAI